VSGVPVPSPVAFDLSGRELQSIRSRWLATAYPVRRLWPLGVAMSFAIATVNTLNLWTRAPEEHRHVIVGLAVATAVGIAGIAARSILWLKQRRRTTRIAIAFGSDVVNLSIDGHKERVRWYAVNEAFDLTDAFVIARRDDADNPIVITKRAFGNDAELAWAYFEDRLTGTLPNIRALGFSAPTRLRNTQDHFLTNRATA
jgi:hypothetical protein